MCASYTVRSVLQKKPSVNETNQRVQLFGCGRLERKRQSFRHTRQRCRKPLTKKKQTQRWNPRDGPSAQPLEPFHQTRGTPHRCGSHQAGAFPPADRCPGQTAAAAGWPSARSHPLAGKGRPATGRATGGRARAGPRGCGTAARGGRGSRAGGRAALGLRV